MGEHTTTGQKEDEPVFTLSSTQGRDKPSERRKNLRRMKWDDDLTRIPEFLSVPKHLLG